MEFFGFVLFFCLNVFHGCLYAGAFIKNKLFIKHMSIKVTFNIRKLKVKSPKILAMLTTEN